MITQKGLCKEERLHGHSSVDLLFKKGDSFLAYPFKCVYCFNDKPQQIMRIMVSVGKRYHKRAVKRNVIKRRAKEAYRLNKNIYYDGHSKSVDVCFIYVGKKEEDYKTIENGIKKAIFKIKDMVSKSVDISVCDIDKVL